MISREEAITELKIMRSLTGFAGQKAALSMAIEALEKQMPKKPKEFEDKYYTCPECGNLLMYKWMVYPEKLMPRSNGLPCCFNCLQAIDWSDSE